MLDLDAEIGGGRIAMAEAFDPYHKWLGISTEEQPPNHYRLLGIRLFEKDLDVIEAAAAQRVMLLRSFQTGPHSNHSQELLNEVMGAKICLLNPEKRAAYDEALRQHLSPEPSGPPPPPPAAEEQADSALARLFDRTEGTSSARQSGVAAKKRQGNRSVIVGAAVAGGLLIVGLILWGGLSTAETALMFDWPEDQRKNATLEIDGESFAVEPSGQLRHRCPPGRHRLVAARPGFEPFVETLMLEKGKTKTVRPVWRKAAQDGPPPPAPSVAGTDKTPSDGTSSAVGPSTPPVKPEGGQAPEEPGDESPKVAVAVAPERKQQPPPVEQKRLPVPLREAQQQVAAQLEEVYGLSGLKTPEQKLQLARELLDLGRKSKDSPTEQYVLLRTAGELACDGGDAALMFEAVGAIGADYDVDLLSLKQEFLARLAQGATNAQRIGSLVEQAFPLVDQALAEGHYELASQVIDVAYRACTRPAGKEYRKQALDRRNEVQRLHRAWKEFQGALATLETAPEDAGANLIVGRWYCFKEGDWKQGLPHLAKGSDEGLRTIAQQELDSPPTDAAQQVDLADFWWDLADLLADEEQKSAIRRACYWYEQAISDLTALQKVRIEKRLEEAADLERKSATTAGPRPGAGRPVGASVDVLKWVDLRRDWISGEWKRSRWGITTAPLKMSNVMLPVEVVGSYELAIDFTRAAGDRSITAFLPVGTRKCTLIVSGWSGRSSGIGMIGSWGAGEKANPTNRPSGNITNGVKHTLLVTVRPEGSKVDIKVLLDGEPYISWEGEQSLLRLHPNNRGALRAPNRLTLGSDGSPVTFHSARLRFLSGKASPIPSAGQPIP